MSSSRSPLKIEDEKPYVDPAKMREAWQAYLLGDVLKTNKTAAVRLGQVCIDVSFGIGKVECAVLRGVLRGDNPSLALLSTIVAPTRRYFLVVVDGSPHTFPYAAEVVRTKDDDPDLALREMMRYGRL
jgi:hypothetical protein